MKRLLFPSFKFPYLQLLTQHKHTNRVIIIANNGKAVSGSGLLRKYGCLCSIVERIGTMTNVAAKLIWLST
ncbi:hypothetical protein SAMN06269250_6402 [Spirosoma fluviale]|uniref:Uncharacterized protein n=1 Tax=Spirosoma fluviale TaxID=1597977 RepID=A0A286GW37_9BACT|nr:hypothetical protein SAMN06269250_6402 [Spirosoma fluviale]